MKTKIIKIKTYSYNELSEEAKERVIEKYADINVDCDWWDFILEEEKENINKKYGIDFEVDKLCFDLGYGGYIYFLNNGLKIVDKKKFLKELKKTFKFPYYFIKKAVDGWVEFKIDFIHYGGGNGKNTLTVYYDYDYKGKNYLPEDLTDWLYDEVLTPLFNKLSNEYDYLTSREAIEETIKANDFEFLEDGSRTIYI